MIWKLSVGNGSQLTRDVRISDRLALVAACALLLGATASRLSLPAPASANLYHSHVAAAAATIPLRSGEWIAHDVPVPTEAIEQLRPNILISRQFENLNTGDTASLLLVQCRDVRDLAPHYPPICYPGKGLTLTNQQIILLKIGRTTVNATRYTFESNSFKRGGNLTVDNFMILPDGHFQPDMQGMERRIGADQRYFGAAQVQIIHGDGPSASDQTSISNAILDVYEPLIATISNGGGK